VTDEHIAHIDSSSRVMQQLEEKAKSYVAIDPETGRRNPTMSELAPGLVKAELDQRGLTEDGGSFYETQAGQNAFRTNAALLSQHFVSVASQIDSRLAGEAAVNAVRGATDKLGAQVYAHPVPAQVALSMSQAATLVKDPNGSFAGIGAQNQNKVLRDMQEAIATRAVEGSIRQFPNQTLRILQQPPEARDEQYNYIAQYVPNEKINGLINSAETMVSAQEAARRQALAEDQRQITQLHHATDAAFMAQDTLYRAGAKGEDGKPVPPLDPVQIGLAMMPDENGNSKLDGPTGRAILSMLHERANQKEHKTDDATYWGLFERIYLPDGDKRKLTDVTEIYKAATGDHARGIPSKLSPTDMGRLRDEFTKARDPEGFTLGAARKIVLEGEKPSIDTSILGRLDRSGSRRFAQAQMFALQEEERMRKEGNNPHDLYDETSPHYIAPRIAKKYHKSMMEQINDYAMESKLELEAQKKIDGQKKVDEKSPSAQSDTTRRPGESYGDWKKRVNP
jgi:hypothetical protein